MSQPNTAAPAAPVTEAAPAQTEQVETPENESPEALAETTEASPAGVPAKTQTAIKKAIRQLKLKVDGKELTEELPFDLPDDPKALEYMQRQLQLSKMGQGRAQHAAELQKEVTSWIEQLRKDPKGALSIPNLGIDLKKLAQQVIEEEIENSKKSPEQLEKEKLQAELKAMQDERKKEKEDWEKAEMERLQEHHYEQYETRMIKALEGSDLPKSPYVVKKMAEYMLMGLQNEMDLGPEDVLPLVRDEITNDIKEMFAVMPEEVIEKLVGKEKINSLRKKKVAKAKEAPPQPISKALRDVGETKKPEAKTGKPQTYKDFFKI